MSVKLDAGSTSSNSFKLDEFDYPKGICEIIYSNEVRDGSGNLDETVLKVGLRNVNTGAQIQRPIPISSWVDSSDTPYASLADLLTDLTNLVFYNGGGNGGGVTISQQATNYSSLTAGTTTGDIAYVEESEGTAWLPGSMGGTYYPKGWYVWDGSVWVSDRNAIANQLQTNIDDIASRSVISGTPANQQIALWINDTTIKGDSNFNFDGTQLQIGTYGSGSVTGTATRLLGVDASGNIIEEPLSGGGGATQLSELSDVNTSTPTNRNVLIADGVDWESRALTEADISDLGTYLTSESDPIFSAHTVSNIINGTGFLVNDGAGNWSYDNSTYLTSISGLSHTLLSDIGTNTHAQIDSHIADSTIHFTQASISITESQISDLQSYLTSEVNDLTASVVWANVPDVNITESSVTQHEAALTITESQISDLSHFSPTDLLTDYGFTDNSTNWNTAFGWGDHSTEGYLTDITGESLTDLSDVPAYPTGTTSSYIFVWDDNTGTGSWVNDSAYGGGGGVSELSDLSDVNTSTPTNRNVLIADGVDWESRALTEADISDLGSYLENVSEDATPQLGGDLDLNSNDITGTGNINITGTIDVTSDVTLSAGDLYIEAGTIYFPEVSTVIPRIESDPTNFGIKITDNFGGAGLTTIDNLAAGAFSFTGVALTVNPSTSSSGILRLYNNTGSGVVVDLKSNHISGITKNIELPNASGNLTLSVNGNGANTLGEITYVPDSREVVYDNSGSGLTSTDVENALNELDADINTLEGAGFITNSSTDTLSNKSISFGDNTFTITRVQLNSAITDANVVTTIPKGITVESPSSSEDISIFKTSVAITITAMYAVVRGTSPSVTWTIRHSTDRSATGNQVVTGGTTTTSQTTGSTVVSFNDATIPAGSFIWLETTATSGTVEELNVTFNYTID